MKMCTGYGRKRGECTNEAIYHDEKGVLTFCAPCQQEMERRDSAAVQAEAQRVQERQLGLVTVWE